MDLAKDAARAARALEQADTLLITAGALRAERERRGWSQEKAAAAAGMNLRHYQKLETADAAATLTTLEKSRGRSGWMLGSCWGRSDSTVRYVA